MNLNNNNKTGEEQENEKIKKYLTIQNQPINMYALEQDVIYSGETEQFENLETEWIKMIDGFEQTFSIKDTSKNGGIETVNELIEKFSEIPTWKYVINYIFTCFGFTFNEENRIALFEDIKNKKIDKKPDLGKSDLTQILFAYLVEKVQERFERNKLPEKFCREKYIRTMILELDEKILLESMAFGMDMTIEMVNIFLTKVLRRSELDYYDSDEFLLAIALQSQTANGLSHYEQYLELKSYYNTIKISSEEKEEEIDMTKNILDYNSQNFIKTNQLFLGKNCTEKSIQSELNRLLRQHHLLEKPCRRTSEKVFLQWLKDTQELYHDEVVKYKEFTKKISKQEDLRKYGAGILQIQYKPNMEIQLKKGARFYRKKEEGLPDKKSNRVWFVLEEEKILPAKNSVVLIIPVQSITKGEISKKKHIKNGSILQLKINNEKVFSVKAEKALNYYMTEKDQGKLEVECEPGTFIEKNTLFVYIENGKQYEFISREDQRADVYISDNINVYCRSFNKADNESRESQSNYFIRIGRPIKSKKSDKSESAKIKYYEIAARETICYMEDLAEGIISIKNLKPINYQEEAQEQEKSSENLNFLAFVQYLYHSFDYDEEILKKIKSDLFGIWFTSTEITDYAVRHFTQKKDREKRNYILTLIFLVFVKKIENKDYEPKKIRCWFEEQVDDVMEECRLQKFSMGSPYDCLLAFLIVHYLPVEAFRAIWAAIKEKEET